MNNKISLRQLQALLILEIFGFGVTGLPRRVALAAGQDGWIAVVLAAGLVVLAVLIIARLATRFSDRGFHEYACDILGKFLGTLLTFVFFVRLIIMAALNLRIFGEIVRETLLPTTPPAVVFLVMLAIAAYGASKGFEGRARVAEVLVLIALLPLILVFGISGRDMDFTNLLPMITASPAGMAIGVKHGFFAFSGVEVLLLVGPYLNRPKHLGKASAWAVGCVGIFMTIVTIATIARFGSDELARQLWPVLRMMDTLSMPGSIIDRQGALIMTFWIISAFAIINAALFFSSLLLKDGMEMMRLKISHTSYIIALIPVIAIIALLPRNLAQVYEWIDLVDHTLGLAFMAAVPIILLVVAKLRRRGD